jgi:hypothetical protein
MDSATYINELRDAIRQMHGAGSVHVTSVPVREPLTGEAVWEGVVEVFMINGHPKAKTAYAWFDGSGHSKRVLAVLHLPPIDSPLSAVRTALGKACISQQA